MTKGGDRDVYRISDKLDEPTLDVVVTRLEARGKHPRFIAMMAFGASNYYAFAARRS